MPVCPLCASSVTDAAFHQDNRRDYFRCSICALVFVPSDQLPDVMTEKACYDQHQNDPADPDYRTFLRRLTDPLTMKLSKTATGLDFGSGPGPTLSVMMQEQGFSMQIYDPVYAPELSVMEREYDFITATEVFEHLHKPSQAISTLVGLIKQGGWLAVMTKRIPDDKLFSDWHYTRDPTHVIFFADETFYWIANQFGFHCELIDQDVVLLEKLNRP